MRRVEFLAKTLIWDLKKAFLLLCIEPGAKGQKKDLQFSILVCKNVWIASTNSLVCTPATRQRF